uniref:Uncharacterized protein n=1 Tax=Caenorhabditis tropicalis TaxID=1561998 RepID=A0A1I7TD64_9PELO
MFLNHRPLLVFLLFLASSPVDVVSRVLYSSSDSNLNEFPRNQTIDHLELDVNPLHLLCPVCSLLQGLVGGILKPILGGGLLKQIGILVCALGLSTPIKLMFVPNLICTVVFELLFMITKKVGSGLCPLLLLCPMPKQKTKATKSPIFSADEEYENHILSIIENKDSANLSPQMEFLFKEILKQLPMDSIESAGIADSVRHVTRNFVAALQYHLSHRDHYLAIVNQNG